MPPEALLDIDVEGEEGDDNSNSTTPQAAGAGSSGQQQQQQQRSVQGEIAFLSHEPVVSTSKLKGRTKAGEAWSCGLLRIWC